MLKRIEWLLVMLQVITGAVLLAFVCRLNMLGLKYVLILGAAILIFAGITALLTKFKVGGIIGIIISVVIIAIYGYGIYMVRHATTTLEKITNITVQENTMAVLVRSDDSATQISDVLDKEFAINTTFAYEHTKELIDKLNSDYNASITVKEYKSPNECIDDLRAKRVDVVVVNEAFLDILTEIEGYENVEGDIKIIYEYKYTEEIVVEESVEPDTPSDPEKPSEPAFEEQFNPLNTANFDSDAFVVYISGSDTRSAVLDVSRSDVNILAFVNPNKKQILLVNTPRDYYVPLTISNGVRDKLTHAGIYGIDVSMGTLGKVYGITADYYVQLNFVGFEKLIDALGGVNVYSSYAFSGGNGGVTIKEGYNYLNGEQALGFARERYQLPGGDRQRGKNQMAVIEAVIKKAESPAVLTNYTSIMNSMQGTFATNMSMDFISSQVKRQLDEGGSWNVTSISVDGTGKYSSCYSMPGASVYVMVPNVDTVNSARAQIENVMNK